MKLTHAKSGQTIDVVPEDAATYESQGWVRGAIERPGKNASTEVWHDYAKAVGFEAGADMSRDDLIAALS